MNWRAIIWMAKCLALCILGVFICGEITSFSTPPVWWILHKASATYLNRWIFQFKYFFVLRAVYGSLLGLIPMRLCIEAIRSMNARFRTEAHWHQNSETDWRRPILWAWVPLAILFLARFAAWQDPNRSVLANSGNLERFDYFFNPMALASLNPLAFQAPGLVFDIVIITGPMVFLLAYTAGVWLRHQIPGFEHPVEPPLIEPEEQPANPH